MKDLKENTSLKPINFIIIGVLIGLIICVVPLIIVMNFDLMKIDINKTDVISFSGLLVAIISVIVVFFLAFLGLDHFIRFRKIHNDIDNKAKLISKYISKSQNKIKKNKSQIIKIKNNIDKTFKFNYKMIDVVFDTLTYTFIDIDKLPSNKEIKDQVISYTYESEQICNTYSNERQQRWSALNTLKASGSGRAIERLNEIWNDNREDGELRKIAYQAIVTIRQRMKEKRPITL